MSIRPLSLDRSHLVLATAVCILCVLAGGACGPFGGGGGGSGGPFGGAPGGVAGAQLLGKQHAHYRLRTNLGAC